MSDEIRPGADQWLGATRAAQRVFPGCDGGPAHTLPGRPVNNSLRPSSSRSRDVIRGLYAITPDWLDTEALLEAVQATLGAGTRLLQYRNKVATASQRRAQLQALQPLCRGDGCTLVVNDDWRLALDLGIDAVHIGAGDGDVAAVRAAAGPGVILGVSCYADMARAREMAPHADYLAFGSMFASATKPRATSAALDILGPARSLGQPVVAIGGINASNARTVLDAGADAVAVIHGVFGAASVAGATTELVGIARATTRAPPFL